MNTPMQEFITILYRRPTDAAVPVRVVSFFDSLLSGHKRFSHEIGYITAHARTMQSDHTFRTTKIVIIT